MRYNFDEMIGRRGTDSVKYDVVPERQGRNDLPSMQVTDMNFRTPPFVIGAIRHRLDREVLGYTFACEAWYTSIINRQKKRHGQNITREMLTFTPGIVHGLAFASQCFTAPGDRVMVMPPVYHPFSLVTEHNHWEVVYGPLVLGNGQYQIDFKRFHTDMKGCRILILSNPHNPGGCVWIRGELAEVVEICYENQVLVISDEIRANLTLPGYTHPTFALVSEKARRNSLAFMSSGRAFSVPRLASPCRIIEDEDIRRRFQAYMEASKFSGGRLLAYFGVTAAYSNKTEWLGQVLEYIQGNIDSMDEYLRANIPAMRMIRPQASYLIFLGCRELELSQKELVSFFVDDAHLALNDDTMFGEEREGFMRLNVACPRSVLEQALDQAEQAYGKEHDTIT